MLELRERSSEREEAEFAGDKWSGMVQQQEKKSSCRHCEWLAEILLRMICLASIDSATAHSELGPPISRLKLLEICTQLKHKRKMEDVRLVVS